MYSNEKITNCIEIYSLTQTNQMKIIFLKFLVIQAWITTLKKLVWIWFK